MIEYEEELIQGRFGDLKSNVNEVMMVNDDGMRQLIHEVEEY